MLVIIFYGLIRQGDSMFVLVILVVENETNDRRKTLRRLLWFNHPVLILNWTELFYTVFLFCKFLQNIS